MMRSQNFLILLLSFTLASTAMAQKPSTDTVPDANALKMLEQRRPQDYIIKEIDVITTSFDPALVLSISNLAVGETVSIPGTDKFSKAIQNLWAQRYFSNVEIFVIKVVGNDLYLQIKVEERARLSDYKFVGIKKTQAEDLEEKVGLVRSRVITENMKRNAKEAIIKFFFDKGFPDTKVTVTESPDPKLKTNSILTFNIVKGKKQKIDKIQFFNNTVPESKLKKQMKGTKEMPKFTLYPAKPQGAYGTVTKPSFKEYLKNFGFLSVSQTKDLIDPYFRVKLSGAKLNYKKFAEDKEAILEYYNSLGYRDAKIVADTVYNNGSGHMNIDIKVDEGKKYYFGNITWKGNTKFKDSILNFILGIKKGDIYNQELLEKRVGKKLSLDGGADVSSLYVDDGYLFFRAEPVETAVYGDTIDYEIRVTEGPEAVIGAVSISGNDKTKEHVIRRELRTVPGEKFRRSDLIRSQREIAQLNFFDPEKIGVNYEPNQEKGTVDLKFSVVEKSSDQLELSAGWGGGIGLTGTLGVSFNNFSIKNITKRSSWDPLPTGDGQKLSLRYQANGRFFNSYNFSFTEPWLGGKKRNSFTISTYNTTFRNAQSGFGIDKARGDTSYLKTFGATVAFGKQLKWPDDFFQFVASLNYTRYKLRNYDNLFRLSNGQSLGNINSNNINVKLALSRSSVDNPQFPRSGSSFTLSGQFTPPWSVLGVGDANNPYKLVEFHKWRFNGEWYVPIGPKRGEDGKQFILKLAAKYGMISRYSKDREVSPFERFQVGDAGLTNNFGILGFDIIAHRGYPIYETSNPRVNPDNVTQPSQFFTIFNKYQAELRYPFSTNPNSTIYGLAFLEAANGWYSTKEWNPFQLRRSAGIGMRFFLPMFGLLGFDYGIGLDRFNPNQRGLRDAAKFTFMLGFEPE